MGLCSKWFGKPKLLLLLALIVVNAITDGFRILTVTLLFPFIGLGDSGGFGVARVFDFLGFQYGDLTFFGVVAVIVSAFFAQSCLFLSQSWVLETYVKSSTRHLRFELLSGIGSAKWKFLQAHSNNEFEMALTSEMLRTKTCIAAIFSGVSTLFVVFSYLFYAFFIDVFYSSVLIVCGSIVFVFSKVISHYVNDYSHKISSLYRSLGFQIYEIVKNIKFLKANDAFNVLKNKYENDADKLYHVVRVGAFLPSVSTVVSEFIAILSVIGIVYYIVFVGESGGEAIAVLVLFLRAFPRVTTAMQFFQQTLLNLPALRFVLELVAASHEASEKNRRDAATMPLADGPKDISFKNVSVKLGDQEVLKNVSFSIPKGCVCAIVGPSGAGKTTLIDVLLLLHDPDCGEVEFGGVNSKSVSKSSWRRAFCYLPQGGAAFSGSILENITWFGKIVSSSELGRAVKRACVEDFCRLDPICNDLGRNVANLSGGQQQRVGLARAFLHPGQVVVLDEPTSALDSDVERRVWDGILSLRGQKTTILVTHSLERLREVDVIIHLKSGRVSEQGAWGDLIAKDGNFASSLRMGREE